MEILFAFGVFYLAWRLSRGVLREIGATLRLAVRILTWPLLWLARRQVQTAQRHRQRAGTMQELRALALPPGGGSR
jgi:hypothetical protein